MVIEESVEPAAPWDEEAERVLKSLIGRAQAAQREIERLHEQRTTHEGRIGHLVADVRRLTDEKEYLRVEVQSLREMLEDAVRERDQERRTSESLRAQLEHARADSKDDRLVARRRA